MANIIQEVGPERLKTMTPGERRLAQRLKILLEDDYTCWYDIPIGKQQRYPDFILLHPARGLLFLEVKDWKLNELRKMSKETVTLEKMSGVLTVPNPFVQVRQYVNVAVNLLKRDILLQHSQGVYQGRFVAPYGWGVVFTNITRKQIEKAMPEEERERLLPDHLMIYKDEMTESVSAEEFQERLWGMFHYTFKEKLTLPQLDRIRWHLFPEVRIDAPKQDDFFDSESVGENKNIIPDIVRILDIQQEQLARGLGDGHRVIHGVAGSGKTLILGYRAELLAPLAEARGKPILILCFNTSLAAKLRSTVVNKGIAECIQVYHFHEWCGEQIRAYHADMVQSDAPYFERQVLSVIKNVDNGLIPRAQYSAVLIDEGHDFAAEWLKLIVQMIDPETNSLLLLYDDAQSIYKKQSGLGFTLSSVGIQAKGRTSILRLNYRNTREILEFAYRFVCHFIDSSEAEEGLTLIEPEAAGGRGPEPKVHHMTEWQDEIAHCLECIQAWREQGLSWGDMAIIYVAGYQGKAMAQQLRRLGIAHLWMASKEYKKAYDPSVDRVTVLSIQSSKGLEFPAVVLMGIGKLKNEDISRDARLLYVGMTRAQQQLHICGSERNMLAEKLDLASN